VSVRKIPYSLRYHPYGQGGHKVFPYCQRGYKDSTLRSRGYLKIKDTISDFLRYAEQGTIDRKIS